MNDADAHDAIRYQYLEVAPTTLHCNPSETLCFKSAYTSTINHEPFQLNSIRNQMQWISCLLSVQVRTCCLFDCYTDGPTTLCLAHISP
jgi:hypothetical protein